mmetsp:Transcript_102316/g.153305  ORF Transcript_102316/g.153305 Transcript_102316/m.153305 type:complete len:251 (+) Transcript_102316:213-965(+)
MPPKRHTRIAKSPHPPTESGCEGSTRCADDSEKLLYDLCGGILAPPRDILLPDKVDGSLGDIVEVEDAGDRGDEEGQNSDAKDAGQDSNSLSRGGLRNHVPVANRSHGDGGKPKALVKFSPFFGAIFAFADVDEVRTEQHRDHKDASHSHNTPRIVEVVLHNQKPSKVGGGVHVPLNQTAVGVNAGSVAENSDDRVQSHKDEQGQRLLKVELLRVVGLVKGDRLDKVDEGFKDETSHDRLHSPELQFRRR